MVGVRCSIWRRVFTRKTCKQGQIELLVGSSNISSNITQEQRGKHQQWLSITRLPPSAANNANLSLQFIIIMQLYASAIYVQGELLCHLLCIFATSSFSTNAKSSVAFNLYVDSHPILLFNCIQHFPLSFTYNSAISCWTFNSGSLLSVFTSVDKSININPNLWWLANYYHLTVYNGIIMKTDRKIVSEKKTEGGNA